MKKRPNRPIDTSRYTQSEDFDFDFAALSTPELVMQYCLKHNLMNGESTDIKQVIISNPNLELVFENLGDNDAYIEKISDERYKISVNKAHPKTRQNFSMAHEYAHYQLHRSKIDDMPHGEKIMHRNEKRNPIESEANRFAADILMPEEAFKQVVRARNGNIIQIATDFNVSPLAVQYRAKTLGIGGHGV